MLLKFISYSASVLRKISAFSYSTLRRCLFRWNGQVLQTYIQGTGESCGVADIIYMLAGKGKPEVQVIDLNVAFFCKLDSTNIGASELIELANDWSWECRLEVGWKKKKWNIYSIELPSVINEPVPSESNLFMANALRLHHVRQ